MPRTKGSVNRPERIREEEKAAAAQVRAWRTENFLGVRGRLPDGVVLLGEVPENVRQEAKIRYEARAALAAAKAAQAVPEAADVPADVAEAAVPEVESSTPDGWSVVEGVDPDEAGDAEVDLAA